MIHIRWRTRKPWNDRDETQNKSGLLEKERSSSSHPLSRTIKLKNAGLPLLSTRSEHTEYLSHPLVRERLGFPSNIGKNENNNHRTHCTHYTLHVYQGEQRHAPTQVWVCVCVHRCAVFAKTLYLFLRVTSTRWLNSEHIINYSKIRSKSFRCTQPSLQRSRLLCTALSHTHWECLWSVSKWSNVVK